MDAESKRWKEGKTALSSVQSGAFLREMDESEHQQIFSHSVFKKELYFRGQGQYMLNSTQRSVMSDSHEQTFTAFWTSFFFYLQDEK